MNRYKKYNIDPEKLRVDNKPLNFYNSSRPSNVYNDTPLSSYISHTLPFEGIEHFQHTTHIDPKTQILKNPKSPTPYKHDHSTSTTSYTTPTHINDFHKENTPKDKVKKPSKKDNDHYMIIGIVVFIALLVLIIMIIIFTSYGNKTVDDTVMYPTRGNIHAFPGGYTNMTQGYENYAGFEGDDYDYYGGPQEYYYQ